MPAVSSQQRKLMCGICNGNIKKKGISKKVACEYCTPGKLPKTVKGTK